MVETSGDKNGLPNALMQLLDLTLDHPAANLALDESLLNAVEHGETSGNILRLWESASTAVVVGRGSRVADEVEMEFCRQQGIPILRRTSGGASVVLGRGCLMYSLIVDLERRAELRAVSAAHRFVLDRLETALCSLALPVERAGLSDLAVSGKKVSGNSLRVLRNTLLYHGTLLHDFPLPLIGQCLRTAPRQPEYREGRTHDEFVTNLQADMQDLKAAIIHAFESKKTLPAWPEAATRQLVEEKYSNDAWNFRLSGPA